MRLFLDTNVLIDYFSRRTPFFDACIQLRCAQTLGDCELWASAKSFTDVFYVVSRLGDGTLLQEAMLESLSFLKVCSIDGEDIAAAARACWPDFEDCLIDVAARKVGADRILTRDLTGFTRSRLPVLTPQQFFEWLRDEHGVVYKELEVDGEPWQVSILSEKKR